MIRHAFINITKQELVIKLKKLNIRPKYYNQICDGVKNIINDTLDDFILQSVEQNRQIEGQESLESFQTDKRCNK